MLDELHSIMLTHEAHVVSIVDVVWQLSWQGRRSLRKKKPKQSIEQQKHDARHYCLIADKAQWCLCKYSSAHFVI